MAPERWDPFQDLMEVQKRMNRLFESALAGATAPDLHGPVGWQPAAEVVDTPSGLEIRAELPGIDRQDIRIELGEDTLTLHGERRQDREGEETRFFQLERSYGPFARRFRLPDSVDRERISAQYQDGVLRITLPKRPEAHSHPIRVVIEEP